MDMAFLQSLSVISTNDCCTLLLTCLEKAFHVSSATFTWVWKRILSATCTLVYRRRSTWHPFMTLVIAGSQCDVHPWQCIPLPWWSTKATIVPIQYLFPRCLPCLSRWWTCNQMLPALWTSVQISESVHFRTHVYWAFFLVLVGSTISQNIWQLFFNTLYM